MEQESLDLLNLNEEIAISGEGVIKKSQLVQLYENYIVKPIKNLLTKSEEVVVERRKVYGDVIVFNEKHEILLLLRKNDDDFMPGVWGLVGGSIEEGEDPEDGAQRELMEETGLRLGVFFVETVEIPNGEIHYHTTLTSSMNPILLDVEEHINYEWVDLAYLTDYPLIQGLDENLDKILPLIKIEEKGSKQEEIISTYQSILENFEILKSAFDQGLIGEEQYFEAKQLKDITLIHSLKKALDEGELSDEEYLQKQLNNKI